MSDIDLIPNPPPLARPVLYLFRSGALRQSVHKILKAHAESPIHKRIFGVEGPKEFYKGLNQEAFFPVFTVCVWSDRDAKTVDLTKFVNAVSTRNEVDIALFVPVDSLLQKSSNWSVLKTACIFIEELPVTDTTIEGYLRFLVAKTDLVRNPNLIDEPGFTDLFREYVRKETPDLFALKNFFDRVVLLQTDHNTGDFREVGDEGHGPHLRANSLRQLRRFIAGGLGRDFVEWLRALDERYGTKGWSAKDVVCELYRLVWTLSKARQSVPPNFNRNLVLWSFLCLAWEKRILDASRKEDGRARRPPDLVMFTVEQMGREFMARSNAVDSIRHLHLPKLVDRPQVQIDDRIRLWRVRTLEMACSLLRNMNGSDAWTSRLRDEAQNALACMRAESNEEITADSQKRSESRVDAHFQPARFGDIIGQAGAVEGLRRRLWSGADRSILLYGPKGVGKLTLARLYAKAVFCAKWASGQSPCGQCESCMNFDSGTILGYTEFDASRHNSLEAARLLANELKADAIPDQRVYVVRSADSYSSQSFDVFLKRFEDLPSSITFILLAEDLRKVRLAIQSRCEIWAMKPLNLIDSKSLAQRFCSAYGLDYDDALLTLVAQASRGLPQRLHEQVSLLQKTENATFDELKRTLGLDWMNDFIRDWLRESSVRNASNQNPQNEVCKQEISSLQILLAVINNLEINEETLRIDPGLSVVDRELLQTLIARLNTAANLSATTSTEMWRELAESALRGFVESNAANILLNDFLWLRR